MSHCIRLLNLLTSAVLVKKLFTSHLPGYVEDANRLCQNISLTVHNMILNVLYSEKQKLCVLPKNGKSKCLVCSGLYMSSV